MKVWKSLFLIICAISLNSIIYGVVSSFKSKTFVFWTLSPYILFFIAIVLVEKVFRRTKSKSTFPRVLLVGTIFFSILIILIGWSLNSVKIMSQMFIFIFLLQIFLSILNILLLIRSKKDLGCMEEADTFKSQSFKEQFAENKEFIEKNIGVKSHRKDVMHALAVQLIIFILIIILYIIIPIILRRIGDRSIILYFATLICFVLVNINDFKNKIYYGNGKKSKKLSIIEAMLIIIGLIFHYYFEGVVYYKSTTINFFAWFLPMLLLSTVLNTNYKMSMEYYKFLEKTERNKKND